MRLVHPSFTAHRSHTLTAAMLFAFGVSAALSHGALAAPKILNAEEAAKLTGKHIFVATGAGMPSALIPAVRQAKMNGEGQSHWYWMTTTASGKNFTENVAAKLKAHLFFISPPTREAATAGYADIHRDGLFSIANRLKKGEFGIDTVLVRVSAPDKDGKVSLGTTADVTMPVIQSVLARGGKIIAEINPNVPYTNGTNKLRYDDLAAVVHGEDMLAELPPTEISGEMRALAKNIARIIPNRRLTTIQVGIGGPLAGLGEALQGKRLKAWSEMGTDAWLLPTLSGKKPALRGGTFSFIMGSKPLYEASANNPRITMDSMDVVNDPTIIAQQKRMTAINTALEVDILGNVNAERIGDRIISAPGGQPNFMEGAAKAKDGHAVMALRSLTRDGKSTIVLNLNGPLVTTPAEHVDHVVTEWGATPKLRGLDGGKRTYQIIAVAHPLFRKELAETALQRKIIDQKQYDKLLRSIRHAIIRADLGVRTELAQKALAQGLLTQAEHDAVLATIPEAAPVVAAAH